MMELIFLPVESTLKASNTNYFYIFIHSTKIFKYTYNLIKLEYTPQRENVVLEGGS